MDATDHRFTNPARLVVMLGCRTEDGVRIVDTRDVADEIRNCWTAFPAFEGTPVECRDFLERQNQESTPCPQ